MEQTTTQTEVTPELRLKRLNMLLEANEKCEPKLFDMTTWGRRDRCGTVHCLAGNFAAAYPNEGMRLDWSEYTAGLYIGDEPADSWSPEPLFGYFGLGDHEGYELFFAADRSYADSLQAVRDLISKYTEGSAT